MLYLSDIEYAREGSIDSVSMVSIFDIDKYDFKTDMTDMQEILSPYLSLLSPLDSTVFEMFFVHEANAAVVADYLGISATAIYKRINAINSKLKSIVYLNMDKETLYNFIKTYIVNDANVAKYIVQFVFQRTSNINGEDELNFDMVKSFIDILDKAYQSGVQDIDSHLVKPIKRNNKRHYAYLRIKRIYEVINHLIDKKAYRYSIFRGDLSGIYIKGDL